MAKFRKSTAPISSDDDRSQARQEAASLVVSAIRKCAAAVVSGLIRLVRIVLLPVRLIFGHDIFISYARGDGSRYAGGLAHALRAKLHVRIDTQETRSGPLTPWSIQWAIMLSRVLVVVATPRALTSPHVRDEVRLFRRWGGASTQVVADAAETTGGVAEFQGLPIAIEVDLLSGSTPSDPVVRQVEQAVGYWKVSRRQTFTTAVIALIVLALLITANRALRELDATIKLAEQRKDEANTASTARTAASLTRIDPTAAALVLSTLDPNHETDAVLQAAIGIAHEVLATTLRGHTGPIETAAFSPDSTHVVTASYDGTARVWRADGRGIPVVLRAHAERVVSAVFSPDSTHIATASQDRTARVWRADGEGNALVLRGHAGVIRGVVFSSDGGLLATAASDGTVRVWRTTGQGDSRILPHPPDVYSVSFSPDGSHLVSGGSDGTARVWPVEGGEPVILRGHERVVFTAAFNQDGTHVVTAGQDGTVRVWRADGTGEPIVLRGHTGTGGVVKASFSRDGSHIVSAGGEDQTARVWRSDGVGDPIILRGHTQQVFDASFDKDGKRVVTASVDGTARMWRTDGSESTVLRGHDRDVIRASFSPDSTRVVTASLDNTARVWPARAAEPVILAGHDGSIREAAFSPDGMRIVTASDDGTVRLWRTDMAAEPQVFRGHIGRVFDVEFSSDGRRVVSAGEDGTARVWHVDDGRDSIVLSGHVGLIWRATFSADGTLIATAGKDGTARIWTADGTARPMILSSPTSLRHVAFSPDDRRVVTAGEDGSARIWPVDGIGDPVILSHSKAILTTASFSVENEHVLTASLDGTVRIWRVDGGRGQEMSLIRHREGVLSAMFSPTGRRALTVSGAVARTFDVDGTNALDFEGPERLWSASFSSDGHKIVTIDIRGVARVWHADGTGDALVLAGHKQGLLSASFSPNSTQVVTASIDHTARIWRVTWPALLNVLRSGTNDCLTTDQRRRYLGESSTDAARTWLSCEASHDRDASAAANDVQAHVVTWVRLSSNRRFAPVARPFHRMGPSRSVAVLAF